MSEPLRIALVAEGQFGFKGGAEALENVARTSGLCLEHLLLGEHHRAALGWGEFPYAGVAALHRGNHRLEFHLFLGECHRVHAASPFRFSYVRPLWSTPIFVDYSCESAERVLSFSRIHCTVSCRTAFRSSHRYE